MPRYRQRNRRRNRDIYFNIDKGLSRALVVDAERPLTTKFYARHDWPFFNCSDDKIEEMREKHHRKLLPEMNANVVAQPSSSPSVSKPVPRHVATQPMTENQMYGWYQHRAFDFLKKDCGVYEFPREGDPMIKMLRNSR